MSISRVAKMICEVGRHSSLSSSEAARKCDVDIILAKGIGRRATVMAPLAVALALRSFSGEVRVRSEDGSPLDEIEGGSLQRALLAEARNFGEQGRLLLEPTKLGKWTFGIGGRRGLVCADASGWRAAINAEIAQEGACMAPAAVFAVSAAFAKLFSAAIFNSTEFLHESWIFNLAYPLVPERLLSPSASCDLGFVQMLGAGALGSALAYTLKLSDWNCRLQIIDKDFYDSPNHETTMLIGRREVAENPKKALALANLSRSTALCAEGVVATVVSNHPLLSEQSNSFLCGVDNPETRRILDSTCTGVLLNAGLGGDAHSAGHVMFSRHLPGDRPLSQRYGTKSIREHTRGPTDLDECSRVAYENASMAAPFLATAGGALLAANAAFHTLKHRLEVSYLKFDLFRLQSRFQTEP